MKKKSAVGVNQFVKLAAVVIVLVLFILIIPSFTNILEGAVQTGECQWDLLFSAMMQKGTAGLAGGSAQFKGCRAVNVNITMESLYEYQLEAAQRMQVYRDHPETYHLMIAEGFGVSEDSNEYYDKQLEWALNKIIAKQMLLCWSKVWKGSLPVFDQWWNLIDWRFFGALKSEYKTEQAANVNTQKGLLLDWYGPPTFCYICARLKFDRDVRLKFGNRPITSLKNWMAFNPAPDSKKSYLEELLEGQTIVCPMFIKEYSYTTNEPYAIVYKRINPHKVAKIARWLGDKLGVSEEAVTVNQIALAPYDKIVVSREQGGEGCFPPVID